MVQEGLGCSW